MKTTESYVLRFPEDRTARSSSVPCRNVVCNAQDRVLCVYSCGHKQVLTVGASWALSNHLEQPLSLSYPLVFSLTFIPVGWRHPCKHWNISKRSMCITFSLNSLIPSLVLLKLLTLYVLCLPEKQRKKAWFPLQPARLSTVGCCTGFHLLGWRVWMLN